MATITQTMILGVRCDKPGCEKTIYLPRNAQVAEWEEKFQNFIKLSHWSIWVGRGRRYYCRDHGPSKASTMRQVT